MKHLFRATLSVRHLLVAALLCLFSFSVFAQSAPAYQPGVSPFSFALTPGALPKSVAPKRTTVHFDLDPYSDSFSGIVTHLIDVVQPTSKVMLHSSDLVIERALLKGSDVPLVVSADKASQTITLSTPSELAVGSHEITLHFSGKLNANGYGLYFSKYRLADGSDKRMLVTQLESIGAREMMPCFDEPAFRTVWDVSVSADEKYTALSNMPVAKQTVTAGKRRTEFAPTPGMSSYLLAIAVGEFEKTADRVDNIDLAIYTVAGKHQNLSYAMDATKKVLAYYKDYFGTAYPLPKLDQIAVPGKRGAMENWGLITYSEDLLMVDAERASYSQRFWSFNVIAHEIAHQWFGNLVTMAWWDGLWLNESFAEWMGYKATAALNPKWNLTASRAEAKEKAMAVDALANTLPIERPVLRDQTSGDLFDPISYEKGHSVLNMIERYAGETEWRDGLRDYMVKHAYSNATSADLWAAISRKTPKDVQDFASAWTRQSGFPLLKVTAQCRDGVQTVKLVQSRFALKPGYVPQQTWKLAVLLSQPGNAQAAKQTVFVDALQPKEVPAGRCGDAVLADVGGTGYYRVSYDASLQKALDAQTARLSAADRLRLLSDAWALAEAGLVEPKRAFDLIAALRATDSPELWAEAMNVYGRVDQLLRSGPSLAGSQAHARTALGRAFEALGWEPKPDDTDSVRSLRADLIAVLGKYGDAAVLAEARKRVAAFVAGGETAKSDVLNGAFRAVGARASANELEQLVNLIASGKHADLEWPLMTAITSVRDPAVASRVLALSTSDQLPSSMAQRLVGRVARNGLHDRLAWQFTRDNLPALFERNSSYTHPYVIAAPLHNSRDGKLAAAVKALVEEKIKADARDGVLREIAGVERNRWAYDAVIGKLGFLRTPGRR